MSKDQLFIIHEEIAKVDKYDQYEETSKEWVTLMTEAGLDIPRIHASQRDDSVSYTHLRAHETVLDLVCRLLLEKKKKKKEENF